MKRVVAASCLLLALLMAVPAMAAKSDGPLDRIGVMGVLGPMDVVRTMQRAKGKVIIIVFWASWCAPCRAEVPELKKVREIFDEDQLLLLGLSVDEDAGAYAAFVTDAKFNYPVRRVSRQTSSLFRVGTVPRLMVYNTKGELVANHEGPVGAKSLEKLVNQLLEKE